MNVVARLETSNHDGYCSGEESAYDDSLIEYIYSIDNPPKNSPVIYIMTSAYYCRTQTWTEVRDIVPQV